jgi:pimeloyl-ACP methyl ester carboxylesterase
MPVATLNDAEIHYEEYGQGFPILLFAPGGMRSRQEMWHPPAGGPPRPWNDWTEVLAPFYRVVAMDQRNAGQSRAPISAADGWHSYADDHLALMTHLGHEKFHTLGGCIGGTFCLKVAEAAPERITSMVLQNPIGLHPDFPRYFPDGFLEWSKELRSGRPEIDEAALQSFGEAMWGGDFVFGVSRDFVCQCKTPALVLPGDDIAHPQVIGLELAELLPGAEMLREWKGPAHLQAQRERVIAFLARHTPG